MRRFPRMRGKRKYQLKELRARHHEILRQKQLGASNRDIARNLDVTPTMIQYTVNSELGIEKTSEMNALALVDTVDVAHEIQEASVQAIRFLRDIVSGDVEDGVSPALRARTSVEILDRAGFGKTINVNGSMNQGYCTPETIKLIKSRAREIGIASGNLAMAQAVEEVL